MPWVVNALLLAFKTKRGRELLLAGGIGAVDIARSKRARELYARVWGGTTERIGRDKRCR